MFVSFPTRSTENARPDRPSEVAIEIDDVRRVVKSSEVTTLLVLDDHAGGLEHLRVRMSYTEVVKKINHAKLYAASFVANDVVAAQGGS